MKRNLISYYYFTPNNEYIKYHISLLKKYSHIFDGKKVIYISTDKDINIKNIDTSIFNFINPDIVKIVENNPENRESEYFIDQVGEMINISDENSMTFYTHSKGSTYGNNSNLLNWIVSMYFFNLEEEYIKLISSNFSNNKKKFSGIFRIPFPCQPWITSNWHYSGTFFWINNRQVFVDGWDDYYTDRFSVESYPGKKFDISDSMESEILFNEYSNSLLPSEYNRYDLRYPAYWEMAFKDVIGYHKYEKFNIIKNEIIK